MSNKKKDGQSTQRRGVHKGPPYKAGGPGVRKPGRREWMRECLKLLEAMMDLEDSKPFREPVDCAKYPDYYTIVSDPIDLSKVNFKFRGNQYNDPDEFATDVRQLFANYKMFFKDPNSEIFSQLHRLSWWFDAEFKRIVDKWGFKWMHWHSNSSSQGGSTSMEDSQSCSPPPQQSGSMPGSGSMQGPAMHQMTSQSPSETQGAMPDMSYIQMVQQSQYMVPGNLSPSMPTGLPSNPGSGLPPALPPTAYGSAAPSYTSIPATYAASPTYCSSPYPTNNPSTTVYSSSLPHAPSLPAPIPIITTSDPPDPTTMQRPRGPPLGVGGRQYSEEEPGPLSIIVPEKTPPPMLRDPGPLRESGGQRDTPVSHRTSPAESDRSDVVPDQLELTIANTNVWFGPVRLRSQQPVILREDGFSFSVSNDVGQEFSIDIRADEIVRCVAHLGNNKKHTIFLFVLPNCTKRLQDLDQRFSGCSLIVIFTSTLSSLQISLMLHVFHNMSKNSIFGNLFSETDQNGALNLLANIKPGTVSKMTGEKGKEVHASRSLDVEYTRFEEADRVSERPLHGGNRLQVPSIGQERRSLSLNDAPMVAAANERNSGPDSRPLDLSSTTCDNSMWNGAVHSNRNLSRTKFHFKQRSLEVKSTTNNNRSTPPRLGQSPLSGVGAGSGLLRKAQRQYAVDNVSDEEECASHPPPLAAAAAGHTSGSGSNKSSLQGSSCEDMDTREPKQDSCKQSSLSSRGSCSTCDLTIPIFKEQCSTSDDLVMTEMRVPIRCPITQLLMRHPVRNIYCNHSYDREGVETIIRQRGDKARCPVVSCNNQKPLILADMVYDQDLWKQIQTTLDRAEPEYTH